MQTPTRGNVEFLGPVLATVAVSIVMGLLSRSTEKPPHTTPDGALMLLSPRGFMIIGMVAVAIAITLSIVIPSVSADEGRGWVVGMASGFAAVGALLIYWQRRARFIYDDERIRSYGVAHVRSLRWDEVEHVRFGTLSSELTLRSASGKVKAHSMMVGFKTFLPVVAERLGAEMTTAAVAAAGGIVDSKPKA